MNWLSNLTPPGIKNIFKKEDDGTSSLWVKCGGCGDMIFHRDLETAQNVCPSCGHHMKILATDRLKHFLDDGDMEEIELPEPPTDPLKFKDEKKYVDRLKDYRKKTGERDAMKVVAGKINGLEVLVAIQNFDFMGGSMGMALGEAFVAAAEEAVKRGAPLIVFTASGGARMQEGILSLMQMPRTTIAVQMLREAKLPYIVVLTHPTTGGVTASYAMLGDVNVAEPGALIGFAGPRVIEQTIREKLPEGFQRAEFLKDKGMVDIVVHRHELKPKLATLLYVLTNNSTSKDVQVTPDVPSAENVTKIEAEKPPSVVAPSLDKAAE